MNPHTILYMLCQSDSRIVHAMPRMLRHGQGWGQLDNLLVLPLDCAVPLEHMGNISVLVSKDLDLNMLWARQKLLDKDSIHAERVFGFGTRFKQGSRYDLGAAPSEHTLPTTTACSQSRRQNIISTR